MKQSILLLASMVLVSLACGQAVDPFVLVERADRLAETSLWPTFDPGRIPVAVYDGTTTYLFRHPQPPEEFAPVHGADDVWFYEGRYGAVNANTSAEIDGVQTATVMLDRAYPDRTGDDLAAMLLHEAFHVFQRQSHPGWQANEADLFVYPMEDVDLLAQRHVETDALRRAFLASSSDSAACWTRAALAAREARFRQLDSAFVAYERGTELNEGLATYVEHRALGASASSVRLGQSFAADEVRVRAYRTGLVLAVLLDRFAPDWTRHLEQNDTLSLDELLDEAVRDAVPATCAFARVEKEEFLPQAQRRVADLRAQRAALKSDFRVKSGWKLVVITSEQAPLWPQGFDPLNVHRVAEREVLHTRYVKVGHEGGSVEVLGREALTEGMGPHPIFNGVRKLVVTGLNGEPRVEQSDGTLQIQAEGCTATFQNARVERSERTLTVWVDGNR